MNREKAKEKWMSAFEEIYDKAPSMFEWHKTLIVTDTESMVSYGEDGKEYTLQIAPWEKDVEDS